MGIVFGTIWTLTQVFDGLPVDGGAPSLIEIPDLTGSMQAQALEDLQALGFKVGIENSADASVPAGSVIRTQPSSNTIINPDSLVTIIVSVGPEAFPIPYVLDIETERALYVVEESGFSIGQLLEVNDDIIPRGFVISQNPVAGTKMSPGSTVPLLLPPHPTPPLGAWALRAARPRPSPSASTTTTMWTPPRVSSSTRRSPSRRQRACGSDTNRSFGKRS